MSKEQEIRTYAESKVNPIFSKFMVELLTERPQSVVDFTIEWMKTKGYEIEKLLQTQTEQAVPPPKNNGYDSQSEEEDEADEVEDLPQPIAPSKAKGRVSVSAEVYGSFNKKENFEARVIPKSEEQKERIKKKLLQSFMFQALDKKELEIVVNAMEVKEYQPGQSIIEQGEDGDNLYVVDSGEQNCFKRFKPDQDETFLKVYKSGESFGELSLLYNCPRAASIRAKSESVLFALDRACFNNIVKESAIKRRQKYEEVLKKIDILQSLENYELTQICDGIKEEFFEKGQYIIRQGDQGDRFYMIEDGKLIATKNDGDKEKKVFSFKEGDYFGELALIKNIPRQANIVAETDCKVVYLDAGSFKRLLGPIEEILGRNMERYDKYINNQ